MPIMAVGFRHLRRPSQKREKVTRRERLPTVSIVVPVKNEERVIGRLLEALSRLDYPPEKKEIVIVEDGSTDKTMQRCKEYMGRFSGRMKVLHKPVSDGKPSALNYAVRYAKGEIVAVFDADNVPEPDALIKAAEYFEDPSVAALQGTTCSLNADENMLTKFVSYEEAVRFEVYVRGKDALSLFVPLTGSCCFIRRSVLEEVGEWDEDALSEDVEMSVRLTEKGYNIKYAPDLRSWQENPAGLAQLMRQRMRWLRGCMEIALKYGKLVTKLNRRNIDAELTLTGPYMFATCFLGYLMTVYTLLIPIQPDPVVTIMAQVTSLLTIVLLLIVGVALIYVTKPRRVTNLLWLPFIYAYWSLQTFMALYALVQIVLRRPKRWVKTAKTGKVANSAWNERA